MDHVAMPVETEVEICATEDGEGAMGQVMEDSGTGRIDRKQTTQLEFSELEFSELNKYFCALKGNDFLFIPTNLV